MNIPETLTAGDTWDWLDGPVSLAGAVYDSAGYSLSYALRGASVLDIAAVADGDGWRSTVAYAATASLTAGRYVWSARLQSSERKITAGHGVIQVLADLSQAVAGMDTRTTAEKALADAEGAAQGWTANRGAVKKWKVNNREQEFHSLEEILKAVAYWRGVVSRERRQRAVAQGQPDPSIRLARFK